VIFVVECAGPQEENNCYRVRDISSDNSKEKWNILPIIAWLIMFDATTKYITLFAQLESNESKYVITARERSAHAQLNSHLKCKSRVKVVK